MNKLSIFVPIAKVDEEKGEVWGIMAEEAPDRQGEILDYAKSKQHFIDWSESQKAASGGKSLGNVREMHSKIAAGKLIHFEPKDAERQFVVGAKIDDVTSLAKVKSGTLTGFSVGGEYGERWADGDLMRYIAKPQEVSLVDRPAMPGATFTMVKADGTEEQRPLIGRQPEQFWACPVIEHRHKLKDEARKCITTEEEEIEKRDFSSKQRKKAASSGAAMSDGSYPIENRSDLKNAIQAYGRAKNPAAVKAHIKRRAKALGATDLLPDDWSKMTKSMYDVGSLCNIIQALATLQEYAESETDYEGDGSGIPDALDTEVEHLVEVAMQMLEEEGGELTADTGSDANGGEVAGSMGGSAMEMDVKDKVQKLVAAVAELEKKKEVHMNAGELEKLLGSREETLTKTLTESLAKVVSEAEKRIGERIEKIEKSVEEVRNATPKPGDGPKLRAVGKEEDTADEKGRGKAKELDEKTATAHDLTKEAFRHPRPFVPASS